MMYDNFTHNAAEAAYYQGLDAGNAERDALRAELVKYYRWAYALQVQLAILLLEKENRESSPDVWPAGQSWDQLVDTSRSIFLHQARDLAGINHTEFLTPVRDGSIAVDDLYDGEKDTTE